MEKIFDGIYLLIKRLQILNARWKSDFIEAVLRESFSSFEPFVRKIACLKLLFHRYLKYSV